MRAEKQLSMPVAFSLKQTLLNKTIVDHFLHLIIFSTRSLVECQFPEDLGWAFSVPDNVWPHMVEVLQKRIKS